MYLGTHKNKRRSERQISVSRPAGGIVSGRKGGNKMKNLYLHIRVSAEEKALINRKRGHKTVSEYIRGLVYGDVPEDGLKSALRKYIENMKELEK
jgi:hypothetical protein